MKAKCLNGKCITLITVLLCLMAVGQSKAQNTLLFKLQHPKSSKPSYLFGTMHLKQEKLFNWNRMVLDALSASQNAAFELDLQSKDVLETDKLLVLLDEWGVFFTKEILPEIMKSVPADSLSARINRNVVPALQDYIQMLNKDSSRISFVDQFLFNFAKKNCYNVFGIETVEEQLDALNSFDRSSMKQWILEFLSKSDWSKALSMMEVLETGILDYYAQHNLSDLCNYVQNSVNSDNPELEHFFKRLLDDRNKVMFKRTVKYAKTSGIFIGVGAGHLCGRNGLISLYEKAGFTVTPINITGELPQRDIRWGIEMNELFSVQIPQGVDSVYIEYIQSSENSRTLVEQLGEATFNITGPIDMTQIGLDTSETVISESHDDGVDAAYQLDTVSQEVYKDESEVDYSEDETINHANDDRHPKSEAEIYLENVRAGVDMTKAFAGSLSWNMYPPKTDTLINSCSGQVIVIHTFKSAYAYKQFAYIGKDDSSKYKLVITGDRQILESGILNRFYTSFCIEQ